MNLRSQKRIAADVLGVGVHKVVIDPDQQEEASEAITREDIRDLVKQGVISAKKPKGNSRGRVRKRLAQKKKRRQSGPGKRTGAKKARTPSKAQWINKIRAIRDELATLKKEGKIDAATYRLLYRRAKGNLFHSRRHLHETLERMRKQ